MIDIRFPWFPLKLDMLLYRRILGQCCPFRYDVNLGCSSWTSRNMHAYRFDKIMVTSKHHVQSRGRYRGANASKNRSFRGCQVKTRQIVIKICFHADRALKKRGRAVLLAFFFLHCARPELSLDPIASHSPFVSIRVRE